MKKITRALLKVLARAARPYLQTYGLLRTSKVFNRSALVWDPGNENVLVLAPHMDDEVIGCGGTLARHVQNGGAVTVVFLTDGRHGAHIPDDVVAAERARREQVIAGTRKGEARLALSVLGITNIVFLDAEDGQLTSTPELAGRLRELLDSTRPDLVYLPFFLEEHPDHRAASDLLCDAAKGLKAQFRCHGYEVWTPLFPNCVVAIDRAIEQKRAALRHYQSQLAESDYLHTALGLNAYRSTVFLGGTCRFAEAFCVLSLEEYLDMYSSFHHRDRSAT